MSTFWKGRVSVFFFFFSSVRVSVKGQQLLFTLCNYCLHIVSYGLYTVYPLFMSLFVVIELENDLSLALLH